MNDRQRRLRSIQSQLYQIYQGLFGAEYKSNGDIDEGTEFKAILQRFRQKHFYVREMQKDREKKQKKKNADLTEELLKNQKIREEIKMCEKLLSQAEERIKNGIGKQDPSKYQKTIKNRKAMLSQCYEMLNNVKSVQFGDTFEPKKKHQTLGQLKKRIVASDSNDINLQEEDALSRFRRKDDELEGFITQVRNVDDVVKNQLRTANDRIKMTQEMIENNINVADRVNTKIKKGTEDLRQVLKNYRRPSKLCLDVILILLLLALIGVIINMLKGSI